MKGCTTIFGWNYFAVFIDLLDLNSESATGC